MNVTSHVTRYACRSFAFFAGATSSITSLRCFGIYTGLVVMTDFFLMITYLPSVVALDHIYIQPRFRKCCTCFGDIAHRLCVCVHATEEDIVNGAMLGPGERFFKNKIHPLVSNTRLLLFLLLGSVGGWLSWKAQFLEKPSTGDFQLFHDGHPMELYSMVWRDEFFQGGLAGSGSRAYYPVTFVWGLEPVDNGNKMDPADHGSPIWTDVDVKSPGAQTWLVNFCEAVRNETWYLPLNKETVRYEKCFVENFKDWVTYPCEKTTHVPDQKVIGWQKTFPERGVGNCCSESFPLTQNFFGICLQKYSSYFGEENTGVWYDIDGSSTIKGGC